jgi:hypothetical protein
MPWAYLNTGDEGKSVQIFYQDGPSESCGKFSTVYVQENDDVVVISVLSKGNVANTFCRTIGLTGVGSVKLASPLGDRKLYHAKLSEGENQDWIDSLI